MFRRFRRRAFSVFAAFVLTTAAMIAAIAFAYGLRPITYAYGVAVVVMASLSWAILTAAPPYEEGIDEWEDRYRAAVTGLTPIEERETDLLPVARPARHLPQHRPPRGPRASKSGPTR